MSPDQRSDLEALATAWRRIHAPASLAPQLRGAARIEVARRRAWVRPFAAVAAGAALIAIGLHRLPEAVESPRLATGLPSLSRLKPSTTTLSLTGYRMPSARGTVTVPTLPRTPVRDHDKSKPATKPDQRPANT